MSDQAIPAPATSTVPKRNKHKLKGDPEEVVLVQGGVDRKGGEEVDLWPHQADRLKQLGRI